MKENPPPRTGISRRDFVLLSAGVCGAALLPLGRAGAAAGEAGTTFIETTCGKDETMGKRILVAYASRCGSTGGVAEAIGQALCGSGTVADVRLVRNVADLAPYRAVIVGSAIRMGKWLPEAVDFVKKNREALGRMPTAYFLVCNTMREDTAAKRAEALAYLDPVRQEAPGIRPLSTGLFPGVIDFSKLSFLYKTILKAKGAEEGDFRNWPAVKTWAAGLGPALLKV